MGKLVLVLTYTVMVLMFIFNVYGCSASPSSSTTPATTSQSPGTSPVLTTTSSIPTCSDPEQPIIIGVNEEFVVSLKGENLAMELNWEANYDDSMLKLLDVTHDLGSGIARFKFEALKAGKTEVTAIYVYRELGCADPPLEHIIGKEAFDQLILKPMVFNINVK